MNARETLHRFEKDLQDKFHGLYGRAAFRESAVVLALAIVHKLAKTHIPPHLHARFDAQWYGSLLPDHPLHKLRKGVQESIANWAVEADDYFGRPLQHRFAWVDSQVPKWERYIDSFFN